MPGAERIGIGGDADTVQSKTIAFQAITSTLRGQALHHRS